MGSSSQAAVLAMLLLISSSTAQASFFDPFNIFRAGDFFGDEPTPPTRSEREETGASADTMGLTKVPPTGDPSKVSQDTIVLPVDTDDDKPDGAWSIVSDNSGVSAMHMAVMRHGRAVMFDTSTTGRSLMRLRQDNCRVDPRAKKPGTADCWAHAVEFDYARGAIRPLKILTDTWCSSGAFDADGNLVQTGGYFDGDKAVSPCSKCDWKEHPRSFADGRWYATQQVLPDGRFIVFGGRRSFSYEFVPKPGLTNHQSIPLPFLRETTDDVENNLYPFVNLLPDGSLFVFANDRGIILDHRAELVIREVPPLLGGARNYPGSAMSALLPLDLRNKLHGADPEPEVIICGGAPKTAFKVGENNTFLPALKDCARINLANPGSRWAVEDMPVGRVMGDMLILPTGDLLILSGAARGCSGWGFARQPVLTPLLYTPHAPMGTRFRPLVASTIARVYHSTAALLPDATVLVAGGNTNAAYNFSGVDFPTEVRVERFAPPYLDRALAANRPVIDALSMPGDGMRYGARFAFRFTTPVEPVVEADVKVTMYAPPFTTHGYSMNQRLLVLSMSLFVANGLGYAVTVDAPGKPELAPPGFYLLFVVAKDVPSAAAWVKIQ
ncbi:LOW QUALITY PROTEIN: hypothetical protein BRADI_2g16900v3 [Brachypodium distachyon]|uniref:Galactose oxidase-like Early set domain-containing protein n=1 Tax=Brachypodium distachyon TaxID=15368 RepID=A0A0Q3QTY6_BRADI|nr:LOW QUALITY PROTEIN: hypothetical protein BRADI_2g16900v3 [Brachypodium distachyon]